MTNSKLETFLLVGGKGTRLAQVTGEKLSKGRVPINHDETVACVDYIADLLNKLNINSVHLLTKHNEEQYKDIANDRGYDLISQHGETGTSGAVEEAILQNGFNKQYLVMSVDTLFSKRDLEKLLTSHKQGTVSWAVAPYQFDLMESYHGLVVDNESNAILGDIKLPWWKNWDLTGTSLYVKGAIQIIDPSIYMRGVKVLKRLCKKPYPIDLYWDVFPVIEEENRRRVIREQKSILQAVVFEDPLVDVGTPERLKLTRDLFSRVVKINETAIISNI